MQPKNTQNLLLSILIPSLVGLIIFILAPMPFSYVFYCIFLFLSFLITMSLLGQGFAIIVKLKLNVMSLYFLLLIPSIMLLFLQVTNLYIEAINVILYLLAFILVPGLSILLIFKFKPRFSSIEFLAIAYPLSLAFLSILGTITLIMPVSIRGYVESTTVTLLSITAFIIKIKETGLKHSGYYQLKLGNDSLILLSIITLFTTIYIRLYPKISYLLGLDIVRNFIFTLAFTKDPLGSFYDLNAMYPMFQIYLTSIIYAVKPSLETFEIFTVFLNILAILTFYAMATLYLKQYGEHVPAIATLIWSTFSGLGWVDYLKRMLTNQGASTLELIVQANAFSYGDIVWRRLFFYLPMEASLTLSFAVLYFIKRSDIPGVKYVVITSLLLVPMPLLHSYATYFMLTTLFCFTLICSNNLGNQLWSTGLSLVITSLVYPILTWVLKLKGLNITMSIVLFTGYLFLGLFIICKVYYKNWLSSRGRKQQKNIFNTNYLLFGIAAFILFYFSSLLVWFCANVSFSFNALNLFGYVPWFLYPVKLGMIGLLAIVSIIVIIKNSDSACHQKEFFAFLALFLLLLVLTRAIAMIQMQYAFEFTFNPNSWLSEAIRKIFLSFREERMFEIFKIPLAIIASIVFEQHIIYKLRKTPATKYFIASGIVSVILLSGMASTLLGFTYYYELIKTNPMTSTELGTLRRLQNNIYTTGKAIIIAPQTPSSYLDFTGAVAIVTESQAAWQSKSPEFPLYVTRFSKTTPTYIYLHKVRDMNKLSEYSGSYMAHLSRIAEKTLENEEVVIKFINGWSPPSPESSTALIIPYNAETMSLFEPYQDEYLRSNTTLALFFQDNLKFMNIYQSPVNIYYYNIEIKNNFAVFNGINSYIRVNGTNMNFNKIMVEFVFDPQNLSKNQVIVSKFDRGTPPQKSWEIAQYGKRLIFKLSPDGNREESLSTGELLELNTTYKVRCEYDGKFMKILINDKTVAAKPYSGGIFNSNVDIVIGAELFNNKPTAFAKMKLGYLCVLNDVPSVEEPIFYAYDLLSSLGLNYTTVLSDDNRIGNYKTLILPYDDATTYKILTKLEKFEQNRISSVIILNTKGYGPLLSLFGNISSSRIIANSISSQALYALEPPVEVQKIYPHKNTKIIAQYIGANLSSPLVMEINQSGLKIIYINIYPLLSQGQLFNSTVLQALETLSNYIDFYNETTVTSWFTEPSLLFTKLIASGTINIQSISLISNQLPNNQLLSTESYSTVLIKSKKIVVQSGYGYYTRLIAFDPTIILQGNQTKAISVNGNITLLLRRPKISINGTVQFEDFYMLHPSLIYTDGRTTTLDGNVTLDMLLSDEYIIALPYYFNSPIRVKYSNPLMQFNEFSSFLKMLPYIILTTIFFAPILLIKRKHLFH